VTPRYLLDTNICIFLKNNRHPNVARKLAGLQPGDVAMSVVTWGGEFARVGGLTLEDWTTP
jgi:tRNA(fMet)-specific endonuclease VapC